jgi:hypothetical protein
MKRVLFFLLVTSLTGQAQSRTDSVTYWVNASFLACLDSGLSVCSCQEQQAFLIADLDMSKQMFTLLTSAFQGNKHLTWRLPKSKFSADTLELAATDTANKTTGRIFMRDKGLVYQTEKQTVLFQPIRAVILEKNRSKDMEWQLGRIQAQPLLKFRTEACKENNYLIPPTALSEGIREGRITIRCSLEGHHDELEVAGQSNGYFLAYTRYLIKLFLKPESTQESRIDLSTLSDCQIFRLVR